MGEVVEVVGRFAHFADSGVPGFGGDKLGQPGLQGGRETTPDFSDQAMYIQGLPNAKGGAR